MGKMLNPFIVGARFIAPLTLDFKDLQGAMNGAPTIMEEPWPLC